MSNDLEPDKMKDIAEILRRIEYLRTTEEISLSEKVAIAKRMRFAMQENVVEGAEE